MTGRAIAATMSAAAFMLIPVTAQSQAPSKAQQDAIRSNCRSDYMANCSSVKPGGREALECLMKNKANVSGGCQNALNAVAAPAPAAVKPEPKPEPKAAEPAAPPTTTPAAAAPSSPEAPKAPPPTAAKPAPKAAKAPARPTAPPPPAEAAAPSPGLAAAPPADGAPARPMRIGEAIVIRRFCSNDFKVLCKGVPIGQGRAVQCLADNRGALSPGCRQAMADTGH